MFRPDDQRVPEWHRKIWRILASAFPEGVPKSEYEPLIRVLLEDQKMSFRSIAGVLSYFEQWDWGLLYNDVLGVDGRINEPDQAAVRLLDRLRSHGLVEGDDT